MSQKTGFHVRHICHICHSEMVAEETPSMPFEVNDKIIPVSAKYYRCPKCGEIIYEVQEAKRISSVIEQVKKDM